ncbi:MAG: hypothetical protein AAEJ65_01065 [Planctomycetota bacterium]
MATSSSDKALWDLARFAAPLVLGFFLIEHGTSWEQVVTLPEAVAVPLAILLAMVTLLGCWVIKRAVGREVGS